MDARERLLRFCGRKLCCVHNVSQDADFMLMVPRVFEGIGGGFSRAAKKGEFC
jgi:hypothetical protein